jgi:protein-S-isoprenylcysteine O-methyltransferase Ste14
MESNMTEQSSKKKMGARSIISLLLSLIVSPLALFLAAGTFNWGMGWVSIAVIYGGSILSRVIMALKNPDLVKERATGMDSEDSKAFDRWLVPIIGVLGPMVTFVIAGLNKRFGWLPEVSFPLVILGVVGVILAFLITTWAMVVNRFFSSVVRIQTDRHQRVIMEGPYRIVRHPAYAGSVIGSIMMPLMLGSIWAVIPGILTSAAVFVRTGYEDRTLQAELPGYNEYMRKTPKKLIPGIW